MNCSGCGIKIRQTDIYRQRTGRNPLSNCRKCRDIAKSDNIKNRKKRQARFLMRWDEMKWEGK